MNTKKTIITTLFSKEEEDLEYGTKTLMTGEAFKVNEHLYLQRENDVLHVNTTYPVLNSLHVGFLNNEPTKVKIDYSEFVSAVKAFIYENELDKFWSI